jgi:hypothetical protein
MQTFESFTDERSGNAAVAAETRAHRGELVRDDFAALDEVELVDSSALADPALLAVGRGNPDSGLFATVVYAKRPLGVEVADVFVGDGHFAERVYDDEVVFVEHQLWSNPNQKSRNYNEGTNSEFDPIDGVLYGKENHLGQIEANEQDGNCGPGEVSLGSEDILFIHASIIAGNSAVQEGK